ncbi:hypothetical protein [Solibaculum mannosilyticum]|uniref:hypothetical protein n=1 Tax=Solibaculum mannosilyticum TaxID=2780922 RepID=UPI001C005F46|nr:hypothetical protein [Solibaculum mannosilyticum]
MASFLLGLHTIKTIVQEAKDVISPPSTLFVWEIPLRLSQKGEMAALVDEGYHNCV